MTSDHNLDTFCIAKDAKFFHADNEGSDQTALLHKLTCVDNHWYPQKKILFLQGNDEYVVIIH